MVIGDLGNAKALDNNATNSNKSYGTNCYLAPEAYDPIKRTVQLDIWYWALTFSVIIKSYQIQFKELRLHHLRVV